MPERNRVDVEKITGALSDSIEAVPEQRDFPTFKAGIINKYNQILAEINGIQTHVGGYLIPCEQASIGSPTCEFKKISSQEIFGDDFIDEIKNEYEKGKTECLEAAKNAHSPAEIIQCIQNNVALVERWQMAWQQLYAHNDEGGLPQEITEMDNVIEELIQYQGIAAEYLAEEQARWARQIPSRREAEEVIKNFLLGEPFSTIKQSAQPVSARSSELTDKISVLMKNAYEKYARTADTQALGYAAIESYFAQLPSRLGGGSEFFVLLDENAGGLADQFARDLQKVLTRLEVERWQLIDSVKSNSMFLN